jgi:hypothetical protein
MSALRVTAFLFLAACTSDRESGHMLGEFEAFTEALETLTASHGAAVGSSGSMEAVGVLEVEYSANWAMLSDELNSIQDALAGCDLQSGMMDHVDDSKAALDAMMAEMVDHAATQAGQTDLSACQTEEDAHLAAMTDAIDSCLEAHEAVHEGVFCDGDHMGGM